MAKMTAGTSVARGHPSQIALYNTLAKNRDWYLHRAEWGRHVSSEPGLG